MGGTEAALRVLVGKKLDILKAARIVPMTDVVGCVVVWPGEASRQMWLTVPVYSLVIEA